ncbi:MAG: menaquinone-dependent protoporphyrinogen IX dehydrogenase [Aquincola sp.]|nr:menaquinone-dependent protoporphyrinogen IX dehydrogenase [Aquincola sp.]
MKELLFVYSTTDGHTRRICERLARVVQAQGRAARVMALPDCAASDIEACGAIVVGASIRYGKHKPEVAAFVERHRAAIEARPNAFFSVNVVARKAGKDVPEGNPYLQKFLRGITWKPQRLAVFAGRLDYPSLGTLDRLVIRFIMWMTKGPTDPRAVVEFTDWARVEDFARSLAAHSA